MSGRADDRAGRQTALLGPAGECARGHRGRQHSDGVGRAIDRLRERVMLQVGDGALANPRHLVQQGTAQRQQLRGERDVDQGVFGIAGVPTLPVGPEYVWFAWLVGYYRQGRQLIGRDPGSDASARHTVD